MANTLFIDTSFFEDEPHELRRRKPEKNMYGTFSHREECSNEKGPAYEYLHETSKFSVFVDSMKNYRGQALQALFLFISLFAIGYAVSNYFSSPITAVFIDKKGNTVLNGYNFSLTWEKTDIFNNKASELRPPVKTMKIEKDDVENGYFPTYVYGVGYKNITFDNVLDTLSRICKNCTCIGVSQILLHSNIVFLNREIGDIMMIEPRIDAYSTSSQNAMLKKVDKPLTNEILYLPNYRSVPTSIVVHYVNTRANMDIIDLSHKQSACVYLTIEQNKKYL
jgi:hypothetical protein